MKLNLIQPLLFVLPLLPVAAMGQDKPVHRVVIEEYTGTWCNNCPRGYVGMHLMQERHPEDFVGICFHNNDPMAVFSNYPSSVAGYPVSWVDRVISTDAFYGSNHEPMGIDQVWLERQAVEAPAAVSATLTWNDAETALTVDASVVFTSDHTGASYRLAYILMADSLQGFGPGWGQVNGLAHEAAGSIPYLDLFTGQAGIVMDLKYNDVVIACSTPYRGVEGSVPAVIAAGDTLTHSYTFTGVKSIRASYNGTQARILQDPDYVHAAVLLIDSRGSIVNACNAYLPGANIPTGIHDLCSEAAPAATRQAVDLLGRPVSGDARGLRVEAGRGVVLRR